MQNHLYLYPNLVKARKAKCSQAELAEHLGISQQEVSRYERGETKAPVNYLADVADYCGVSVDYLLGRENPGRALLSADEAALLEIFAKLDSLDRTRLFERAQTLLDMQQTK